jgi:phage terminase large subunit-like protein
MPENSRWDPLPWMLAPDTIEREIDCRNRCASTRYYQEAGPFRREQYPKQLEFFEAGREHRERLLLGGNRVGKTDAGAYEMACHLTGLYPEWWQGRRFNGGIKAWVVGESAKKVREVVQEKLLGPIGATGTGMIRGDYIGQRTLKAGTAYAVDSIKIRNVSGKDALLVFKSYEMGREGFDGDAVNVIWLDEEPPEDIYSECLLRTMQTSWFEGGILMVTMTPLKGLTRFVKNFMQAAANESGTLPSSQ